MMHARVVKLRFSFLKVERMRFGSHRSILLPKTIANKNLRSAADDFRIIISMKLPLKAIIESDRVYVDRSIDPAQWRRHWTSYT